MLPYELTGRAWRDIANAREWYDRQRIDLGNRFVDEVLAAVRTARDGRKVVLKWRTAPARRDASDSLTASISRS